MNTTLPTRAFTTLPTRRIAASVGDLQSIAVAGTQGLVPEFSLDGRMRLVSSESEYAEQISQYGTQEFVELSDDLLLIRTDMRAMPVQEGLRWDYDLRGWLYLHFRLDGVSEEGRPDGTRATLDHECFFLSASSRPQPFGRQVLGEDWRTVGIVCRPSFAMRDLKVRKEDLPSELQRFHSGDPDIDFWYASALTTSMRDVVKAVLRPEVHASIRPIYLRAKAVELVCLALERLRQPECAEPAMRLSLRDVECLHEARRLLRECNPAPSLEQLARHVGINRRKLALGFKQVFGLTVGEYHRERRLELARELLERQAISVGHAASMAGYCDAGSFSKAFHARYGALPSEVRGASPSPGSRPDRK